MPEEAVLFSADDGAILSSWIVLDLIFFAASYCASFCAALCSCWSVGLCSQLDAELLTSQHCKRMSHTVILSHVIYETNIWRSAINLHSDQT